MSEDLQKVKDLLKIRGCSDRTTANYLSCINRFKNYYEAKGMNLKELKEEDILEYLKKSFIATEYIKSGGDIWELKSLLGHSSINSTMIYLHMAEDFSKVSSPLDGVDNV